MTEQPEAIVYDLDGTLVRLDVDWSAVREAVVRKLEPRGVETGDDGLWALLDRAEEHGYRRIVEETIADHERRGARSGIRLPLADEVRPDRPVGVVSLNCEAAVRIALELNGLDAAVGVTVGRDTIPERKPDPRPLLYALERLGVAPGDALFVGDSESDATTADRAGVPFRTAAEQERQRR